ncbi:MAG TPA: 4-hydroxy-tetrahydrodipicolinate synthase [Steroidobacteraceae bacterium]|nr:4-hydroxy-tetrahydrodipicolinate synthase [Steroidobacteraceae bacterium]
MFSGTLVAIVTPMLGDGAIDHEAWDRLLDFHARSGTSGVVVGGSTGESVALSEGELDGLLARARRRLGGRIPVLAGVGGSCTASVVERVRRLAEARPDALLVVTPAYNRPTQEGLYRHFAAIAAAAAAPVLLYNVPSRTAVDLLPATVARLAELPGVVGIKEAVGDVARIRELLGAAGPGFAVLSGDDASACEAVLAGASGVISVTANVVPAAMAAVIAAARQGDRAQAEQLDAPLSALHRELAAESNPIPVKWALAEMKMINAGIRLPLTWLSDSAQPRVRSALQAASAGAIAPLARRA